MKKTALVRFPFSHYAFKSFATSRISHASGQEATAHWQHLFHMEVLTAGILILRMISGGKGDSFSAAMHQLAG